MVILVNICKSDCFLIVLNSGENHLLGLLGSEKHKMPFSHFIMNENEEMKVITHATPSNSASFNRWDLVAHPSHLNFIFFKVVAKILFLSLALGKVNDY